MPEVRQGIPLAEEHEESFEGRVWQGAEGVLPLLFTSHQVQEQSAETHFEDPLQLNRIFFFFFIIYRCYNIESLVTGGNLYALVTNRTYIHIFDDGNVCRAFY